MTIEYIVAGFIGAAAWNLGAWTWRWLRRWKTRRDAEATRKALYDLVRITRLTSIDAGTASQIHAGVIDASKLNVHTATHCETENKG